MYWLTEDELRDAEQRARQFSGAYTGTSGALAGLLIQAIHMIRHYQEADEVSEQDETEHAVDNANAGERLLDETARTIRQRRQTYGPAAEHFARTVGAINAIMGHKLREPLTVADWAQIMILDKLARHQERPHHDNLVDTAGYAACWAECEG
jgi:hypothetical protein